MSPGNQRPTSSAIPALPRASFDAPLVQRVIDLELYARDGTGDLWSRRFHGATDALYRMPPADRREEFARLALQAFEDLGHKEKAVACVGPRVLARGRGFLLRFVLAGSEAAEGADFLRGRNGPLDEAVVALLPSRFLDGTLRPVLLVELEHLEEMLDASFCYDASYVPRSVSPNARRYAVERLRAAWNAHAALSLENRGLLEAGSHGARRTIATSFPEIAPEALGPVLARLGTAHTTFSDLARLAERSDDYLHSIGVEKPPLARRASAPCPLCGFPTHAWADPAVLAAAGSAIASDFPTWRMEQGACERCTERYAVASEGVA